MSLFSKDDFEETTSGLKELEDDILPIYRTAYLLTRSFEEAGEVLHEVFRRYLNPPKAFDSVSERTAWLTRTAAECSLNAYIAPWDDNTSENFQDFPEALLPEEKAALRAVFSLPILEKSSYFRKYPYPEALTELGRFVRAEEGVLSSAAEKIRLKEDQKKEIMDSFLEDGGTEKSTRFNAGWLIPKLVAGLVALAAVFFVIAVIVRAPRDLRYGIQIRKP